MKGDPEQRALLLGEYIVEHGATVRAAARAFGCSKSTVHKDVSVRLRTVGPELFRQVQMVLARNKAERHLPGRRGHPGKIPQASLTESGGVQTPPLCHVIWWNCSSAAFSSRLTCAWLMPISRATSIWVLPLR